MDSQCELARQLYECTNLHVLQWIHLICSFSSVILCIYTARKYVDKSLFESSTKELIIAVYAFSTFHALSIGIAQVLHLLSRYTASVPCDAQIPKKLCILRMMVTSSVPGFCILHLGITTQRLQSTFNFSYRIQKFTSRLFILIAIMYSCLFGFIVFHKESLDVLTPYCTSFNKSTEFVLMVNLYAIASSDVVSALATLGLWWFNEVMLKKERKEYRLEETFHRKQCIYSIKQFLPVTFIHTLTYIIQCILFRYSAPIRQTLSMADYTFLTSALNVMPYYCILAPLTLFLLIRHGRFARHNVVRGFIAPERKEVNKDMYFNQLNTLWSPVPQNVNKYSAGR